MTLLDMPTMRPVDRRAGLPVVIIGAGPVGLAAAAQLLERGIEPVVLEQGAGAGSAVRQWGHIRLFSPWEFLVDPASLRLLEQTGYKYEGVAQSYLQIDGRWRTHVLYANLRHDRRGRTDVG